MENRSPQNDKRLSQETPRPPARFRNPLRAIYDWVLHWAETPYGIPALFLLAFAESSFFPIPPDVLLIALAISIPTKSFRFAFYCTVASILGGCFGYLLGAEFFHALVNPIIDFFGLAKDWFGSALPGDTPEQVENLGQVYTFYPNGLFLKARAWFEEYGFLAILLAALTPIPYKVFTISAGFFGIGIKTLLLGSVLGRTARFFGLALLIYFLGPPIKVFIDKYFNILSILFAILLVGGFVIIGKIL